MNSDYKVGDLIYDADIYDGMNTGLTDLQFYKRWLPKGKDARILEIVVKNHLIQNLDMRMFFPQELDSYLEWSGFNIIHKYGGFDGEAFNDDSDKQIFVCRC